MGLLANISAPPPPARYLNRNIDIGSMAQISVLWRSEKEGSHNQPEPSRKKSVWSACTARTASSHSHSQYSPQYTLTTRPGPQAISSPTSTYSRGSGGCTSCTARAASTWRLESNFETQSLREMFVSHRTPHNFCTRRFGLITAALLLAPPVG